ncbi:MAG: RidA family protein [Pyrinomonadaceae bacterium]
MAKEFINPQALPNWQESFTQVITVSGVSLKTVYISGQVAVDQDQNLIGEGDLGTQAMQALRNLETALAAGGATTADVVRLNIYVKDYKPADATLVGEALRRYFPHKHLPTSTWLGVQALAREGFLIEVDAVAIVDRRENNSG